MQTVLSFNAVAIVLLSSVQAVLSFNAVAIVLLSSLGKSLSILFFSAFGEKRF